MRNLRLALPVAGSALLVVVAACGATGTAAAPPGPAQTTATHVMPTQPATGPSDPAGSGQTGSGQTDAVAIQNFAFAPAMLTVRAGTTVTWTNDDQDAHTVSASGGAFRSAALNHGDSFRFTFSTPGRYDYICTIHPFMTATVVVTP
jgi:plastocyanin